MMDTSIKIISNPYERKVSFEKLDTYSGTWEPLISVDELNSEDLASGFFPFKAEKIVSSILAEFQVGSQVITLYFEGSSDEYGELRAVCESEDIVRKVRLKRTQRYLLNAREVLPEIIRIFRVVHPLVDAGLLDKNTAMAYQIERFEDVSKDEIPLCVMGNYSSGKSTFINALIGQELLPNGDEPVTARVYRITRSHLRGRGSIEFQCGAQSVRLEFGDDGLLLDYIPALEVVARIKDALCAVRPDLITHMNVSLDVINDYEGTEDEPVSDRIDITVPFCSSDSWGYSSEFVIFDTPGSNCLSKEDHSRVLREAMDGMSNGLPLYVAQYDTLDAAQNEDLYREIQRIDAIDERFAMIIVNKADAADIKLAEFDEDKKRRILDMAVPRNLYAQGVYFVSSIMGLGAKIDGEFASDNYAEKYEDQERKYSNPRARFYKQLYRFNILPRQIEERVLRESEECPNLVLANSGLYCIQSEFERFAQQYAAYNKCHQARRLLDVIIKATAAAVDATKEQLEQVKQAREEALDNDKRELIRQLEKAEDGLQDRAPEHYQLFADTRMRNKQWLITLDKLQDRERELTAVHQDLLGYGKQEREAAHAQHAIADNLKERVSEAASSPTLSMFGEIGHGFVNDISEAIAQRESLDLLRKKADSNTADELLDEVQQKYDRSVDEMLEAVDKRSREFWEAEAEKCRRVLYEIATSSSILSDDKRHEIADIIIQYPRLSIREVREVAFVKTDFERVRKFLSWTVFRTEKLDLPKLLDRYNEEIEDSHNKIVSAVSFSHKSSFQAWLKTLLHRITDNIIDYNPALHVQQEIIAADAQRIIELTARREVLERCKNEISSLIDWKE